MGSRGVGPPRPTRGFRVPSRRGALGRRSRFRQSLGGEGGHDRWHPPCSPRPRTPQPSGRSGMAGRGLVAWWGAVAIVVVVPAVMWLAGRPHSLRLEVTDAVSTSGTLGPALARRETRPTLDPGRFVGKAARAHQVAREIPDVLDQLYCYCGCDKLVGHKSLLSCFTDGHGAT